MLENYLQELVTFEGMLNNRSLQDFLGVKSVPKVTVKRRSLAELPFSQSSRAFTVKRVQVPSTAQFDAILAEQQQHLEAGTTPVFALFTGAIVPETGKSWCSDCTAASNKIRDALFKFKKPTILLECPCLRAEYRGNSDFPYRLHPLIQLKAVPQLVKWTLSPSGEIVFAGSVVEGDCAVPSKLEEFFFSK
jgi:hypothetical protein